MSAQNDAATARNRLAGETSPYLRQHQANPVDWYPWGQAAFDAAAAENKPILLSVGYAACHWCHVMAHESFEDPEVAELMNRHFVNIKVDREERPDLDYIYQQALSLLGQHGGWPLTMFLTPQGKPFWGGTYFPKQDMYGRPGFPQVLKAIADAYHQEPDKVEKNVGALQDALESMARPQAAGQIDPRALDEIASRIAQAVDMENGGLGGPPKFPQPGLLQLLWRAAKRRDDIQQYRKPVEYTLHQMSQGGIYDHLGGGYARYAVDARWLVPHFEKMLYDNAQILELLTWAWQDTGVKLYRQRAQDTVGWLLREMIALDADEQPTGAFASTLDADSEGEEGKFYTWTAAEIDAVLGDDAELFKSVYDVSSEGNWDGGVNILNRLQSPLPLDDATEAKLADCRQRLFERRESRVRPGWDDKVLADWNGLMIHALAEAAVAFGQPDWLAAAARAFAFVRDRMQVDGRLRHSWRRGELKHPATLDDHATMASAALTLFEHTGKPIYRDQAIAWVVTLDRHFWDATAGGYFVTADDVADVIVRPKHAQDSSQPAGNGLMVHVLARLHYLTGEARYRQQAEQTIAAFAGEIEKNFVPLATLLNGIERLNGALQIAIIGDRGAADTQALLDVVHGIALPDRVLQVTEPGAALPPGHPAAGKGQHGGATAYVCRGPTCSLPITDPDALRAELTGTAASDGVTHAT
jgi:uncharacterized protein YyaL (SSP411 family)